MFSQTVHRAIPELLSRACPSIRYRLNSEILGCSSSSGEMRLLQSQIPDDPAVQAVFHWQEPDGWLAWDFHGQKSIESGIRILCEKGVDRSHPVLSAALHALENHPERLDRGIGKVGRVLDERGFGGSRMIRSTVFAYAGLEDRAGVGEQVQVALDGFRAVTGVHFPDALAAEYKGRLVYRPGARWPGLYHLRLLACTQGWRTAENCRMLAQAVQRLVDLSPLPVIHVLHKSQVMAPASFAMQDFNPDMNSMDAAQWMMWFHRMEYLARLGVVPFVPELRAQVSRLAGLIDGGAGTFPIRVQHPYFTRWGPYTGLMLERDWRSPQRRANDLIFRSLLILHFAYLTGGRMVLRLSI